MLIEDLSVFCERKKQYKTRFNNFLKLQEINAIEHEKILETLCELLIDPAYTQDVVECFPHLLPALLSMAIPIQKIHTSNFNDENHHRLNCVILGKLVNINDDVLSYVLHYFDCNPAPFESAESVSLSKRTKIKNIKAEVSDYDIVVASYNILYSAVSHFRNKWDWSKFYKYLSHDNDDVKWVAIKCIGIVLAMPESSQLTCAQLFIRDFKQFLIRYKEKHMNNVTVSSDQISAKIIRDIVPSVVSVGNILLPVFGSSNRSGADVSNLVSVPSTEENLRSLAIALSSSRCICLQGAVGSGKTALVEYLAKLMGRDSTNFVKVQLGDQTDSKMLLGMYRCTDIPGEFVWQPGVLTEAVVEGKWLLLEDIDSTALDVASVLSNLIETGTLSVPCYRDTIHANTGFQLFVTQRLTSSALGGLQRQNTGALNLLQKHWLCINIEPLSRDELITIIRTLYPTLTTVATRMVDVYLLFASSNHDNENDVCDLSNVRVGRQSSTRDLIKWCLRAIVDFDVSSPVSGLKLFQDALDVFCYSVADEGQRRRLAIAVAHKLGIVDTKVERFCNEYKPSIDIKSDLLVAGRVKLLRKRMEHVQVNHEKISFSFTRPSACLLERISCCIAQKEPVLLVGETGTGKTSSIQYLARITRHKLVVINMNQQSESADLLGGYKPVDFKYLIFPIREEFEGLFRSYFAIEPNKKFLEHIALCYRQQKWKTLVSLMNHSATAAIKRLKAKLEELDSTRSQKSGKRSHSDLSKQNEDVPNTVKILRKWERVSEKLKKLETQVKTQLAFSFIEGSLIKGLKKGYWVLLDEINLATAETLECLSGLLEGSSGSLSLLERGDKESIKRHPDFTIFACMNPATDVGKRDLPIGLRNRFTEFYVDELTEENDLLLLVDSYLKELNLPMQKQKSIVKFYLKVRKEATTTLYDGTGHKPHYSLRTLCRALIISASNPCGNVLRSLYEAFSLSFLTQLDYKSYPIVQRIIVENILDNKTIKAVLGCPIPKPKCASEEDYICFEGYWVVKGNLEPEIMKNYVLTKSVRQNLKDLVRIVSIGKIPVLLQGDTSVGKTSLITYLAKASGHTCVRINNHEHTDLQEYIGSYVADETGKLVFKEGVLVEAMRKGHWIILDELNLAPSDVLEALNRVLDDNRELYIPETQDVVKAHNNFMLFATQNPPGLYGGRKVLSRAFRNRFVELHFDEIPADELQTILHQRCKMPESYCKQIINVMTDLQIRRKSTAAFAGKQGFITLRDLFRWGERYRLAPDVGNELYDWSQHLADEGYLVLAAKVRKPEEADEIRQVIKKHLKRDVDPENLFTLHGKTSRVTENILKEILNSDNNNFKHIVWTYHMRRMAVLVKKSCQFKEPVLLVGETGGGKTTVCQIIAALNNQNMHCVNCHMHTESSDFLGNLRPVREHSKDPDKQKLFEWVDGPLINAMHEGDLFLADEISLADDSVLERLNSLLEPERSLLLAEKGTGSKTENDTDSVIVADEKFIFIGTMNPGGDYGKKELSPALRNRFTEIWCEGCIARNDLSAIIEHNIDSSLQSYKQPIASAMLHFVEWLPTTEIGKKLVVSIRDILTWVNFINMCVCHDTTSKLDIAEAYYHGACLTYIDSLGSGSSGSENLNKLKDFKNIAIEFVKSQVRDEIGVQSEDTLATEDLEAVLDRSNDLFGMKPFYIKTSSCDIQPDASFTFSAPTTKLNTLKLLRALQLKKPILLEGSPGVGKSSLVSALAKASGHSLLRINLSDQTDVSDLFGADLPVEGGKSGEFAWKDGPFLRALRAGHWILLDELNLASQSVLEGLNACFDHRSEVYIPELGKTFVVKPGTRLFACQNPLRQGGGRRGLPKSFLNRFTQVFVDTFVENDLEFILAVQFPSIPIDLIKKMIKFNTKLASEAGVVWGFTGSPWEMNLRDVTRWCEATIKFSKNQSNDAAHYNPGNVVDLIYVRRMRTEGDRQKIYSIYREIFSLESYPLPPKHLPAFITEDKFYIGDVTLQRTDKMECLDGDLLLLRDQKELLKNLMQCVELNWMTILVGGSGCGKSMTVRLLASLIGQELKSISVNSAMDTTEILGGFEQTDYNRHLEQLFEETEALIVESLRRKIREDTLEKISQQHSRLENMRKLMSANEKGTTRTMSTETKLFLRKIDELSKLISKTKNFDSTAELRLQGIEERLTKLQTYVEQDRCLNAGGKFEWIDSVLVKCLQHGTWLLVDQVNLCSPAVLDRLNGLLEPNGVLSIGERGVDGEGNVVTIKPHPNFRLFLTMDPRYGEISRAMRNRGVELYILGPKENVDYNIIDLKSLLYSTGVSRLDYQNALIEVYRKLSKESIVFDKLTVVELSHSAFLMKQLLSRGFPVENAMKTACVDVYVKAKLIKDSRIKEKILSVIEETIDTFLSNAKIELKSNIDVDAVTWSIRNLQDNSKLTIVRQQGALLKSTIEFYKSRNKIQNRETVSLTTSFFNEFLELQETEDKILNVKIPEILDYLLLNFYEISSQNDCQLRTDWLSNLIANESALEKFAINYKSNLLTREIAEFRFNDEQKILPWNTNETPGSLLRIRDNDNVSDANRLALLLFMQIMNVMDDSSSTEEKSVTGKIMSLKQYSSAVHNKTLAAQLQNQPLITNYVKIVNHLKNCIELILKDDNVSIDTKKYAELRKNLGVCKRFCNLGRITLINKSGNSSNVFQNVKNTSSLLKTHFKWLTKFLNNLFTTYKNGPLDKKTEKEIDALFSLINNINNETISMNDPLRRISKKVKKELEIMPLPHSSKISLEAYINLKKSSSRFVPVQSNDNVAKKIKKILAVQLANCTTERSRLVTLWNNFYTNKINYETIFDSLSEIEEFSRLRYLDLERTTELSEALCKVEVSPRRLREIPFEVQLWPIYEYMFLLYAQTLQSKICKNSGTDSTVDIVESASIFTNVPSIPVDLIGLLNAIFGESKLNQKILLPQMFIRLTVFVERFSTIRDSVLFSSWNNSSVDEMEKNVSIDLEKGFNLCNPPGLLHLILDLVLNRKQSKEKTVLAATMLGTYTARINQLKTLNNMLWRNSVALTSTHYNFRLNDKTTLQFYTNLFLPVIEKVGINCNVPELLMGDAKTHVNCENVHLVKQYESEFLGPMERLREIKEKLENETSHDALERGEAWVLLGYLQTLLFGNLEYIDPILKVGLKLKYLDEDITDYKYSIYVSTLQSHILGTENDETSPKSSEMRKILKDLYSKKENLKCLKAYRRSSDDYVHLVEKMMNFRDTIGSYETINKHLNQYLIETANELKTENCTTEMIELAERRMNMTKIWQVSLKRFSEQLETEYLSDYPDIVLPILAAQCQIKHGVGILVDETNKLISVKKTSTDTGTLESLIYNFIRFPTVGDGQETLMDLAASCARKDARTIVSKNLGTKDVFVNLQEQFNMLKCSLHELHNYVLINKKFDKSLWQPLNGLLQQVILLWKQQQVETEKREAEKESMYKNMAKIQGSTPTEEEEILMELRHLFPTYHEDYSDVTDVSQPSLEQEKSNESSEKNSYAGHISENDIKEVYELHSNIVESFVSSIWLHPKTSNDKPNFVDPLIQRYNTVNLLLENTKCSFSEELSVNLHNSLNFLVTLTLNNGRVPETQDSFNERQKKNYDFYKDANVEEVKQCLPLCESILTRTIELLQEWPEHPTLISIKTIIDRIYSFPVTSPVFRFLIGLQYLLEKMHQWEENAHSGVSLSEHSATLTQLIISWRQLELACWKDSLNAAENRGKSNIAKWWFFLYDLVNSYIPNSKSNEENDEDNKNVAVTKENLTESLERFMNESSLIEFEGRLSLLFTFHCHVLFYDSSPRKDELLAILWNVHNYYKQFINDVNARISSIKAPIEKKLKDFVKIARWNDINYWAVEETVKKTHRTLHKFIKEFEVGLRENVSTYLAVKPMPYREIDKDDQFQREYTINPTDFTLAKSSKKMIDIPETISRCDLIKKSETLSVKAKGLCKEIILMSSYPCIRTELENFIEECMDHSSQLRNAEIDRTQPKERQKSQAKSILQQKKLAISNYFKNLNTIGLSYRIGILTWKNDKERILNFTVPPFNLSEVTHYLGSTKVDGQMLTQWKKCDEYYYKSLIKLNALNSVLQTTQANLGPQNAERCLGYSVHLMLLSHEQKRRLFEFFNDLTYLRMQLSNFSQIEEENNLNIPRQRDLQTCVRDLKELLITLETGFEQIDLYLQCCPAESLLETENEVLVLPRNNLPIADANQSDEVWKKVKSLIKECSGLVKVTVKRFNSIFLFTQIISMYDNVNRKAVFLTSRHFKYLSNVFTTLGDLASRLNELISIFNHSNDAHRIADNLLFLEKKIKENISTFKRLEVSLTEDDVQNSNSIEKYEEILESLINTVLLVIQKKYKEDVKSSNDLGEQTEKMEDDDHDEDEMEKGQLKEKLIQSLEKDTKSLMLETVSSKVNDLLSMMHSFDKQSIIHCSRLLLKCLPVLEQYTLFIQFYFNEQVAAFRVTCKLLYLQLNVFLDLATNGFCVPKDLDIEEGDADQSQEKTNKGGMGLGEGEGEKDVSDRIESEDQLEDARPAGEEKEQKEDKDCKEEEKGIDMSEDFDSKLQDLDKDPDEEEEESDNDEDGDMDKEMGETEEGAEQLDEQIWGEDKEENEDNNDLSEDENRGQGEETGDKELGAKDNKKKENDNEQDQEMDEDRQEEQKKEINELDEPETNDDQIDPYHGKHQPEPEPEPFDLPEDMNLDGEDEKEENGPDEENPFDIDEMKEGKPPPEEKELDTAEEENKEEKKDDQNADSSEEEEEDDNAKDSGKTERAEENEENEEDDAKNSKSQVQDETKEENKSEEKENEDTEKLEEEKEEEKALPSINDPSKQMDAAEQNENNKDGSRDQVMQESQNNDQENMNSENNEDSSNNKGTGQSQTEEKDTGHAGSQMENTVPRSQQDRPSKEIEKRKNPGKSDENRSLLDKVEPEKKKLKLVHTREEIEEKNDADEPTTEEHKEADMCEHVKNSEKFDDYTMDAATEEQVRQQASNMDKEKEKDVKDTEEEEMDVDMHQDEEDLNVKEEDIAKQHPEKLTDQNKDQPNKESSKKNNEAEESQMDVITLEGEVVKTVTVERGNETTFHTKISDMEDDEASPKQVDRKRFEIERMLSEWTHVPSTEEAAAVWNNLSAVTDAAARDLSEKLRLVLEPTQASRLKGDYRTGRRINMRKIIPYIASQFRKDKIWLRRTKPSKRDYQIVLALDDSSSMADNHSKELAFESLSLISKAMTYLEVGQLCVISFGEQIGVLHPLGETFTEQSGYRLIQDMKFDQKKTMVGQLVDFTVDMFESKSGSTDSAKLLVVLSDGRGIYSEGTEKVNQAVRRAKLADIFLVFIIVDNPINKDSILDIRMPIFENGKLLGIRSYMDSFPFPFYMILRDINMLPGVLSDALRQWFEVVGKIDT